MANDGTDYAPLYRRFEGLGRKDQKAILDRFDDDERMAFEAAIAADKLARADEAKRLRASDRQYLAYSVWLGNLVEASVKSNDVALTRLAKSTLAAEHQAGVELLQVSEPMGWRLFAAKLQGFLLTGESSSR